VLKNTGAVWVRALLDEIVAAAQSASAQHVIAMAAQVSCCSLQMQQANLGQQAHARQLKDLFAWLGEQGARQPLELCMALAVGMVEGARREAGPEELLALIQSVQRAHGVTRERGAALAAQMRSAAKFDAIESAVPSAQHK
jgi:hypothetical protein